MVTFFCCARAAPSPVASAAAAIVETASLFTATLPILASRMKPRPAGSDRSQPSLPALQGPLDQHGNDDDRALHRAHKILGDKVREHHDIGDEFQDHRAGHRT